MARKKHEITPMRPDMPVYPIGVAARLLNVHPRTLRIYEKEGLINPAHVGSRRLFSFNDIQWITCLRSFIHDEGISIPGLKKLLALVPCNEIADCPIEVFKHCKARVDMTVAEKTHRADDAVAVFQSGAGGRPKKKGAGGKKKRQVSG